MICGPHLTMDPGSLSRALKYGRYCLPSLKERVREPENLGFTHRATCRQILDVDLVTDCPCTGAENILYGKCIRVSTGILLAQATVGP